MADATWFVGVRGERKGPFTEDDIKGMIQRGEVSPRDVAWKEGMDNWKPLLEVEPFVEAAKSVPLPPPAPPMGPNPFVEYLKLFWKDLSGIFANPDTGLAAAADHKPICSSLAWIVLGIIISALLAMQAAVFDRGTAFGKGLLFELIDYAVFYGLTILAVVPILRSKANWADVFSIIGLAAIPTVLLGLLGFIFIWIHPFFNVLIAVGLVLNILFFAHVFQHVSQLSKRVTLYAVPAIYLASAVVHGVIVLAFNR